MAWIRNQLGNAYFQKRDFRTALYNYQKANDYTLRIDGQDPLTAKIHLNLAVVYRILGHTKDCVSFLESSHGFFHKNSDLKHLSKVLYERGIISKTLKQYERAAEYFEQARTIMVTLNLKHYANLVQHMIASQVTIHNNPVAAIHQLQACIERFQEEENYPLVILEYSKIAEIYLQLKDLETAVSSLEHAVRIMTNFSLEQTPESAECFRVYAIYFFLRKEYTASIEYALKAANSFDTMGLIKDQADAMKIVVDCYQQLGDLEQALLLERQRNNLLTTLVIKE
ncbi:tetratricopeptide repeat protein [Tumebacillus avium]|uniref:tetratricopeptide repeat protein n=1 Tax=Tumebacillus avium TaxID=1903704 RepID=UPI0012FE6628|nr:hypothetical protein [Tumebacillus avium]